nr:glycosyl hydrolase family 18 protein [Veronia pacifica]
MQCLAPAAFATLVSPAVFAAPGAPQISWMNTDFAIVEVSQSASAYKSLVTVKDAAEVPVSWNRWSGDAGNHWRVLLNNEVVYEADITESATQSGSTTLMVKKGGQYAMTVELCSGDSADRQCTASAAKDIVVADTDGAHLDPLPMNVDPNNGNYDTPDNTVVGAYFVEWGVYGRKFSVDNIPAQNLTHIFYGFIPVCGPNDSLGEVDNGSSLAALNRACAGTGDYEVVIHDPWAAVQMPQPQSGHSFSTPYKGTYGQLMALKQRYPDLKIIPSVGGWTLSDPFYDFVDKSKRDIFVASVKRFLQTWKFYDGVDIDWEFPGGQGAHPTKGDPLRDGPAYIALMQELREMLDELEADTGREYELTSAIGSGYDKIEDVDYAEAAKHMDFILAMTYDFYGGWSNVVGHQTALNCASHVSAGECDGTGRDDSGKPRKGPAYTTSNAIDLLLAQGVPAEKLVVGTAMYARGWTGVTEASMSDPSNPMTGVGNGKVAGSWEDGVIDYKDVVTRYINNPNVKVGYDEQAEAPYAWDPSNGDLVTYDNERSVLAKGEYVRSLGLGGLFAWEIDADNGDILNAMQESLKGGGCGDNCPPRNKAPIARAGDDVSVKGPSLVTLDGSSSSDADGEIEKHQWTQTSGPALTITDANTANASVSVPEVQSDTTYVFTLTVIDDKGATSSDSVSITALGEGDTNKAPVANVVAPSMAKSGDTVTLDATGSTDPDGDSLSYDWTVPAGVDAQFSGGVVTFVAGSYSVDTALVFSVSVSDGKLSDSVSATVTVEAVDVGCDNAWDSAAVYTGGDVVTHQGKEYSAKWWTQGQEPGTTGPWGVWKLVGDANCQ